MNKPKYVFSQLVAFMDSVKFCHIVDKYRGNCYVKSQKGYLKHLRLVRFYDEEQNTNGFENKTKSSPTDV
jgi:hypothetical protein